MGSSPRPGSCRGPRGVQVARSELPWNCRLLCAFLQGALLCPTCSGDGEPCFDVLLVVFFFFLLWEFSSFPRASRCFAGCCCGPEPPEEMCGHRGLGQAAVGCLWAKSPWGKLRHGKASRPPLQNHWEATGGAQPELVHQAQAQGHGDGHGAAAPPGCPPPCGSVFWVTEQPRGSCCAPLGVAV